MTNGLLLLLAALFGICIGSFLNVVILRDNQRKTIFNDRSRCPHCQHVLSWYDLVPLCSFLLLKGRCRYCKKPISWQYPTVELLTALLAVVALAYGYLQHGSWLLTLSSFLAGCLFIAISGIDIRTFSIPPEYCVAAGVIGGVGMVLAGQLTWWQALLGAVEAGAIIAVVKVIWKFLTKEEGMGEGDIWIAAAVGATVGYPLAVIALMLAVVLGAVVGIGVAAASKKGLHIPLPFGPFLFIGLLVSLWMGQAILRWYIL